MMEIHHDQQRGLLTLTGRLDVNSSMDLDRTVAELKDQTGDLVIDLSGCPYVSSAGIRILLKTRKMFQERKATVCLAGVQPDVYRVLEMAGLLQMFTFTPDAETALKAIAERRSGTSGSHEITAGGQTFLFEPLQGSENTALYNQGPEILSVTESGYSIGYGRMGTGMTEDTSIFVTAGSCCGFLPDDSNADPEVMIPADPARSGIYVDESISFGDRPAGFLKQKSTGIVDYEMMLDAVQIVTQATSLVLVAGEEEGHGILSLILLPGSTIPEILKSHGSSQLISQFHSFREDGSSVGLTFNLAEPFWFSESASLKEIIARNLTFENITEILHCDPIEIITNPVAWIFPANSWVDGKSRRLVIETKPGMDFEPYKAFLARQLYTDSSRLAVDPLHGGYSAQTFHVTSFDHEGRKMRPTVLKCGSRELIERESDRCARYALPYIFNNSAVILGAEFYQGHGALRYNFVGIGGEETRLRWLTHYYLERDFEFLEPLFDKVFRQILRPWYGQPVEKLIHPYKEHDPTFTFFPHIYKIAKELFDISPEDKMITIPESDVPVLNPYWFLKHEYPKRRESTIEYFTAICHGDLNMQNILLDESMNVYLIDFSETRPRPVISDFARLEAIFLVDNAPLGDEEDMEAYLRFIRGFYACDKLDRQPVINYEGKHREKVMKNVALTLKMRQYALESTKGNPDAVPYFIALLEWVLPVVCYLSMPVPPRKLSMILSSILCGKIS